MATVLRAMVQHNGETKNIFAFTPGGTSNLSINCQTHIPPHISCHTSHYHPTLPHPVPPCPTLPCPIVHRTLSHPAIATPPRPTLPFSALPCSTTPEMSTTAKEVYHQSAVLLGGPLLDVARAAHSERVQPQQRLDVLFPLAPLGASVLEPHLQRCVVCVCVCVCVRKFRG